MTSQRICYTLKISIEICLKELKKTSELRNTNYVKV